jgi:hypothetical protein
MKTDALLRDPGFQLNLLLWMTREQPANAYLVRPLFRELGFDLLYIENPFPLPEESARKAGSSGLDISVTPEPDVLLRRASDKKALYIEAKAAAFSATSSTAKQARGHLLAVGPAFAEVMKPLRECLLCCVAPHTEASLMDECMRTLRNELESAGLAPGAHSVHGLRLDGSDVVYSWDPAFRAHSGISGDSAIVLREVTEETDPSPLFLVFCDQDYPDPDRQDLCRRALQNQAYAVLLCELSLAPLDAVYSCTLDRLLLTTTDGVFEYIGRDRQKRMRRLIRENLFKRIFGFWREKEPGLVRLEEDTLKIQYRSASQQAAFLDWLEDCKRTDFSAATPPPEEALPLLRMMEPIRGPADY